MDELIRRLPKAELHLHIEGSLEPELMFDLGKRNGVELPYRSAAEVRMAYEFDDLQSFLDIYYQAMGVLRTERDFEELMTAYLDRAIADGVRHTEIFFDPQAHAENGIGMETVINGLVAGGEARSDQISSGLILCFLRHLPAEAAVETLALAAPFIEHIDGVGLDSSEVGFPPSLFAEVFAQAGEWGLRRVAHAGEEGPADYVRSALDVLKVERIDHGVQAIDDPDLVERLAVEKIPLTMCPLSNQRLQVTPDLRDHPLKALLDAGVMVTVNSDDPAYFGGYVGDNYLAVAEALDLGEHDIVALAANSVEASFLDEGAKAQLRDEIAAERSA
ncbi:MAG: adenosine deaminase [Actinomycetia bacterium]|nr:adenosine deaminase [Actinomycetes bacterium]MCP4225610.1 adenosine deaminase [Actinomycetes bacterium]MCP5032700.1 adenosine deaminase [Actinomycetes bacterium]